jgi:Zn-dependent protease with chaperone function
MLRDFIKSFIYPICYFFLFEAILIASIYYYKDIGIFALYFILVFVMSSIIFLIYSFLNRNNKIPS